MLKKIMKSAKKNGGFTLAELVVTTAVMGTLAAVAVPRFSDVNEIAKERKTLSNIDSIIAAAGNFYNSTTVSEGRGRFPGQTKFDVDVAATPVFENADFLNLFGGETIESPYQDGRYDFSITGGGGTGQTATSPTITVFDVEEPVALSKSSIP